MADYKSQQQKIKEATEQLEAGIKDFFACDRFQVYLDVMSRFHNYSFSNSVLIAMQKPDATLLAGYSGWQKKFQRHVNAGEQGIKIFAPAPVKVQVEKEKKDPDTGLPELDENGDPVTETVEIRTPKFKVVTVFDVSQTDGKPLPTLGIDELTSSVEHYDQFFEALTRTATVPIGFETMEDGSNGYYHLEEKRIAIREGMSEVQTVKTAIHELAHSRLHDFDRSRPPAEGEDRPDQFTREVQAESIAYVVCQHFGIDTSDYSFGYVASWSADRELTELKASLQTIQDAASSIITEIEQNLTSIQQEHGHDKEKTEWTFYVVPDLMTWARPELFGGRTDIEQFTSFSDAAAQFRELRTENYNFEDAKNDDGIPYARLTLGIQREDSPCAVDLLHVRAGKNVLCDDFKSMEEILSSPEARAALQTVASQLGFEEVLSHRSMTDAEIHDFTYDHFKYDLERGSVPHIESYLSSFEQLYADGQLDTLKPSANQQRITELLDFSAWDNPYFEVQDTPERLSGDLAVLMSRYDPYGAQQYAEILDSITDNNVSYLKEWLSSVAAEGEEFSEPARALMQRLDDMVAIPEIVAEIPAEPQKESAPKEALYEINGRYLHIQEAADGGWDYTYYNPFMEVLDGGHVGDAAMDFQRGRAEILDSLNLSNVPLTGIPVSRLQELTEKCENDLRCPVYQKDLTQARADGEMDQWRISHHATETCAEQFRKEYGKAYHTQQVPEFLHQMVDRYGMERCKIVIASTIQLAPEDGRYSPDMKAAAAKVVIPGAIENHLHDRRRDYWVNCHPVTVNIAMRDLLEIERQSHEKGGSPRDTEKVTGKKPSIREKLERNKAIIAAGSDKEQQHKRNNPQLS